MEAPPRPSSALRTHVPALDGLRAVCVTAVLLYHGQVTADGGFLGVSQFFTLSGFLVTLIVLRARDDHGRVDLPRFWARRYRRLLPASLLTLAGVLLFGATLATEQQLADLPGAIVASVLQVANWFFIANDASYVELFQAPSPVQHFWSLAIEEQFYLLMPLLVVAVLRLTRSLPILAVTFGALAVTSSASMWLLFDAGASIDRLYYGTDTRAAEMLVGCVLAVIVAARGDQVGPRGRRLLGWAAVPALVATVAAFFTVSLTDAELYRGGFLLYSLLTAVVIAGVVLGDGPLRGALGVAPLARLGRLSYGVYLFHWPLILTLNEDRTGLEGWWLFALQAGVSVALAAASARWFENPIRYGAGAPGDRRLPAALVASAVVIAGAGLALTWRDVETDLAGLGEEATAAPFPETGEGGPVRVLAIGDDTGLAFADRLGAVDSLELVGTVPFGCAGPGTALACADWDRWSAVITEADPDIVLFHVSGWDGAGTDRPIVEALDGGFDALTSAGATVAWAQGPVSMADALRADTDPFLLAMRDLTSTRRDVRRLGVVDDPGRTAADLALYARDDDTAAIRVLVVGDSVSRTLGYGLERWAAATGRAVVWSAGTEGCGMADEGIVADATGREMPAPAACDTVRAGWAEQVVTFDPDLVVVVSNAADFQERRTSDWPRRLEPGDGAFDDWLVERYVDAVDVLGAGGAVVVWARPPCASDVFGRFDEPDGGNAVDPARIDHVNRAILPRVVEARPRTQLLDLDGILCPDGREVTTVDGVGTLRSDGVHFTPEGSRWLADTIGPDLLALATT